ncbi:MAG: D-glycero-beta-D-manno-heptose 1-phosphate adenylyltransferase [Cytophagales bacterium]|nr:D-glycero-beta-D-manno-heptose 1-phosphate adenylyltransferase [Cytophagales bacterium]
MNTSNKIMSLQDAVREANIWKSKGEKIVFTNGCFDILHLGHVDYLEKASILGTKLVIGVNSDASVSDIKGPARPICNEYSRSRVLAALAFVDAVVLFGEPTPYELITAIMPHILVKGNDYLAENIVGADIVTANGGAVMTIPLVNGYSTTSIINKILNNK